MKKVLLIIAVLHAFYFSNAQHVGIGNTDPTYNLDLSGRMRIRGGANIFLSAGIWLGGSGADSAVNKVFIGMQADSVAGFYSSKSNVGWGFLFDGRNGNIGLKNATPNFPISFQDVAGDKISLFPDVNGNHYGLGIGNSTMQLMTSNSTSDIVFGYGRSAAFTENMRIKGNGNVGIGVSDPVYPLDISNRMRIRGKPGFSAGIWLNNEANTFIPAFVGMQADNQVGFFGNGAGWSFLMNTQNGAMSFGGNTGQPGQVLTSNGTGSVPTWQGATGSKLFFVAQPSGPSDIIEFTESEVDIPGAVANFVLIAPSKIKFQFRSDVNARTCFACGNKIVRLRLRQNISGGTTEINKVNSVIPNSEIVSIVSGPVILALPAGSYSFKLTLSGSSGSGAGGSISAGGLLGFLSWEVFPN